MDPLHNYREVWLVDFEFQQPDGERPMPVCMVAREFRSGRLLRLWADELWRMPVPPFRIDSENLFVAYFASAEMNCFQALRWPTPLRILDLYAEFRCRISGLTPPCGVSLLGAMSYFGLDCIEAVEKDSMRQLAVRGGDYSAEEKVALLDYCQSDVDALARLLPAMLSGIDIPRALLRGRYMAAVARMEFNGIPIDTEMLGGFRENWESIQSRLIERVDRDFGVFDGRTFKKDRWESYLVQHGIPWPRLESGQIALDDDTFREMAKCHPQIAPIHELRSSLSELRLNKLTVGSDGRNRFMLSPFGSKTGRNQPSNSKSVFGPACWLRSLIRPQPGHAIAYIDWSQQELAIAAALSGDKKMQSAYVSGDFYLTFAKMAKAVPDDATKKSHASQREQFKVVSLGVLYGLSAEGLARKLNVPPFQGRDLLRMHRETFRTFWNWSDQVQDQAMLTGKLQTVFGWCVHAGREPNPRSLRNFPMQGNGSEMMRLACCIATEQGIRVCCPVHDALLIEAPEHSIDSAVTECQDIMRKASEIVLDGFPLRTDAKVVKYPDRYSDVRGEAMWKIVCELSGGTRDE